LQKSDTSGSGLEHSFFLLIDQQFIFKKHPKILQAARVIKKCSWYYFWFRCSTICQL